VDSLAIGTRPGLDMGDSRGAIISGCGSLAQAAQGPQIENPPPIRRNPTAAASPRRELTELTHSTESGIIRTIV